jgi:hypothetical protein
MDDPMDKTQTTEMMKLFARTLDKAINPDKDTVGDRNGFLILVAPFNGPAGQRVNYISNVERDGAIAMMKEVLARWEKK